MVKMLVKQLYFILKLATLVFFYSYEIYLEKLISGNQVRIHVVSHFKLKINGKVSIVSFSCVNKLNFLLSHHYFDFFLI